MRLVEAWMTLVWVCPLVTVNRTVPLEITRLPNCGACASEAMGLAVIKVSDQPLEITPSLIAVSSITNSDQAPFGLLRLKPDKLVAYGSDRKSVGVGCSIEL